MDYPIIIAPLNDEDGGGYLGFAPDLPGCMSDGETPEETLSNTNEAIEEWLETAKRRGIEIPAPGSAARREMEEKAHIVSSFKQLATNVDQIEVRIEEIEKIVREIEDQIGHQDAWARFADLAFFPTASNSQNKTLIS